MSFVEQMLVSLTDVLKAKEITEQDLDQLNSVLAGSGIGDVGESYICILQSFILISKFKSELTKNSINIRKSKNAITNSNRAKLGNIVIQTINAYVSGCNKLRFKPKALKYAYISQLEGIATNFKDLCIYRVVPGELPRVELEDLGNYLEPSEIVVDPTEGVLLNFDSSSESESDREQEVQVGKVGTMVLNEDRALRLIKVFNGEAEGLDAWLNTVRYVNASVEDADRGEFVLLLKIRLEGKAYDIARDCETVEEILTALQQGCKSATSSEVLMAKLSNLRQRKFASAYAEEVEELTRDLERAFVSEGVPREVSTKMAHNAGIKALTNGARNPQTRLLLKAGNFANLGQSIQKFISIDEESGEIARIFQLTAKGPGEKKGNSVGAKKGQSNGQFNKNGNGNWNGQNNNGTQNFGQKKVRFDENKKRVFQISENSEIPSEELEDQTGDSD